MVWCPWASFANIIQDFKVVCLQRLYTYALHTIFFLIRRAVDYFLLISFDPKNMSLNNLVMLHHFHRFNFDKAQKMYNIQLPKRICFILSNASRDFKDSFYE